MSVKETNNKGFVYLVGAGPGRADLITVRGAELLKTADCIICDKLANPVLLSYAGPNAEIKDLRLIDPNVDAGTGNNVGALVGQLGYGGGTITNCYVEGGSVLGLKLVGGLVGWNIEGAISNCYSTSSISGESWVGGLAGSNSGTITNCYSTGSVSGTHRYYVGGLVGSNGGTITNCYSTASVSGTTAVGGLVGWNGLSEGTISNCYSTGSVLGDHYVGGLVGYNYLGSISNCYSEGDVSGENYVGGLVGYNSCYQDECGSITNSYWDIETSGEPNMCGSQDSNGTGCDNANGKTTAEMQTASTFTDAGWDFVGERINGSEDIWMMTCEGMSYPKLNWWQPVPGDYFCPDGVDMIDMEHLALHWLDTGCDETNDYCDWAEISNDSTIDFTDFAILADNWLAGL